jgi:hypothetical protein
VVPRRRATQLALERRSIPIFIICARTGRVASTALLRLLSVCLRSCIAFERWRYSPLKKEIRILFLWESSITLYIPRPTCRVTAIGDLRMAGPVLFASHFKNEAAAAAFAYDEARLWSNGPVCAGPPARRAAASRPAAPRAAATSRRIAARCRRCRW